MEASWKIDGVYKADANKVAAEIDSLGEEFLSNVVSMAKNEASEIHKCFEWDDAIAGQKYRESQAEKIIRFLTRETEGNTKEKPDIRYSYSTGNGDGTYSATRRMVVNESEYERLLKDAYRELLNFRRKYHSLRELNEIMRLIDEQAG